MNLKKITNDAKKNMNNTLKITHGIIIVLLFVCCSQIEIKRIVKEEAIAEFGAFLEFIDSADFRSYNKLNDDTIGVFLTFDKNCDDCPSEYLIVIQDGSLSIHRSFESMPESYSTGNRKTIEYILTKYVRIPDYEIFLENSNVIVSERSYETDSVTGFVGLWNGVKKVGGWDTRGYYFYAEWNPNASVVRQYHLEKIIALDTRYIYKKLKN